MITEKERKFATNALSEAETMLGLVITDLVTTGSPSRKATRMAQLLITAGLLTKLNMSRRVVPDNFASSFDNLTEQLEALWKELKVDGEIDLTEIVFPDEPDDYINLAQEEETVQ